MLHPLAAIAAIASLSVQEALRSRLAWMLGALALGAAGLAAFLGQLALTDSAGTQAALLAALLRLCAAGLVAIAVAASIVREQADQGQQLLLALPIPRYAYVAGKLAGAALIALAPALLFGALSLRYAPPLACLAWSVGLLCELWIVAAFSLLCALTLGHLLPALAATAAFYLLARAIAALQLVAHSAEGASAQQAAALIIDLLAALLPHLDRFAPGAMLVYHDTAIASLGPVLVQTAASVLLIGAATLADFYRKDL